MRKGGLGMLGLAQGHRQLWVSSLEVEPRLLPGTPWTLAEGPAPEVCSKHRFPGAK